MGIILALCKSRGEINKFFYHLLPCFLETTQYLCSYCISDCCFVDTAMPESSARLMPLAADITNPPREFNVIVEQTLEPPKRKFLLKRRTKAKKGYGKGMQQLLAIAR